jgi:hypothetical protein
MGIAIPHALARTGAEIRHSLPCGAGEKTEGFFRPLPEARLRKSLIFANRVWGRYTPTSAGEQSAQIAFLYYRAKLASSILCADMGLLSRYFRSKCSEQRMVIDQGSTRIPLAEVRQIPDPKIGKYPNSPSSFVSVHIFVL